MLCGRCGQENPEGFAFCGSCGAALDGDEAGQQQRKTVTVVFCDLAGSTALGDSTDPEVLEVRLRRYFERMQTIVERHGGTVEKFIGDAVVAIFGVPVAHEDDALRALRAAAEMRDAMPELELRARIGVNTGEILTSKVGTLVTGDAVNVAARLEQAADAGEVLVGAATRALVGAAAETEELAPLALKGKPEPVPAFRLLAVGEAPDRPHDRPFVGRTRELELLGGAWERASAERTCELVTVLGEAGVGKSRLVAEALERMNARVVRARCLPYGEEITYWPVVEVIKQLGALPSDPAAAAAIRSLLGESEQATSVEEIAWAFRKLLGEQAPLVVLVDDIQWGADTFLDLVEHVALLSAAVPLLLVCVARPELLDRRPAWSVAVRLQPLDDDEIGALIGDRVAPELRARIERAAGGNPLFVTEMLAMAGDDENEVEVPPTLSALLTARLDQLDPSERRIVERGAVEGEIFHRGAVQALSPDEPHVTPRLAALVRRELIRPHPAQLPGDDGFRFRHLLIRDAAYDALPKAVRAELHERFGAWIEEKGALVELDEVVGYHFEQAAGYRAELGRPDPALALRAGDRLAAAGQRALDRGDERAAARLLERALTLTRPLRLDVHAELDLAQTHWDDPERAAPIAEDAAVRAGEAGDGTGAALARAMGAFHRLFIAQCSPDELEVLLLEARRRLEEAEDHVGLAYVWSALGYGVANCARPGRRLGGGVRAGAPPQPARRSPGPRPCDRSRGRPVPWIAPGGRGARDGGAPARRDGAPAAPAHPRLAARDARPRRGGPAGRRRGLREAPRAEQHALARLAPRRDLGPRRRPRGREQPAAHRLRVAGGDGAVRTSRPTCRSSAAHSAGSVASRRRRRSRSARGRSTRRSARVVTQCQTIISAPGAGTRPRAPRRARRGRAPGAGGGGRERAK